MPHCFFCLQSLAIAKELEIKFLLRALHFPGKTVLAIMWEYLKLANSFKFSPAQIGLEAIQSYLSQKFSREK